MKKYLSFDRLAVRLLFILVAVCAAVSPVSAQKKHKNDMHKEISEFRLKFVAQEIDLRADQRKQFVELYEKLMAERRAAFGEVRRLSKVLKEDKNPSEADYKALSDARNKAHAKAAEITARYDALFARFLSQKQILKMKDAEDSFRQKMMEMRRNNPKHPHRPK